MQLIATIDGVPVEYYVHAGSEADQTGRRGLAQDLPEGSVRYPDTGYPDYVAKDVFEKATGCRQQTARKKKSWRPHEPHEAFLLQHFRKTIETSFSQLTARFPKQIHATTAAGFVLKLVLFIFAHSLDQAGL